MNHAVLYRRVSTAKQDNSLAAQDALLQGYCTAMEFEIGATFEDDDTSGSVPMHERAGGAAMLRYLDSALRTPDSALVLVTTKQDRLGRDTLDIIKTVRRLWKMNVVPHFAAEGGAMPKTPNNELMIEIKASVAQHERNQIRERITTVLNHKRSLGHLTGTVPYGWDAVPNGETSSKGKPVREIIDNHEEQRWILKMAEWRTAGWSYYRIAKALNDLNVPTKQGSTSPTVADRKVWQCGNVAKVLNNRTVRDWLSEQERMAAA